MIESPFAGDACVLTSRCGYPIVVVWDDLSAEVIADELSPTHPEPRAAAAIVAGLPLDEAEQRAKEWGGWGVRVHAEDVEATAARLRKSWLRRG